MGEPTLYLETQLTSQGSRGGFVGVLYPGYHGSPVTAQQPGYNRLLQ
jgi:hypothetical protein